MKLAFTLLGLAALYCSVEPKTTAPVVAVYSQGPGAFNEANTLICHVSGFHPPDITIQLMNGEKEIFPANQTDLAFGRDWHFYLTRNANFTPQDGEKYTCKVTHGTKTKSYAWESNM
ncbi:beta-2-microglobulin-like [Genypterus blacodes]|uniref:beta-2-microglobulin-like n=1 Tax=Genypterus blacodes TaxID=154954 RepID=UPI003F773598